MIPSLGQISPEYLFLLDSKKAIKKTTLVMSKGLMSQPKEALMKSLKANEDNNCIELKHTKYF